MENKIHRLENALRQIDTAKKQLCRNTAEAKSRVQGSISRQLEALRNREVWLLNQLDTLSGAKEEILQQQSARLNKTLGILQSSVNFPQDTEASLTSKLERLDLGELVLEETPCVSFKCDPARLRTAILDFGKIVSNIDIVSPLQSPFIAPEDMAPSLPKHLEEYEDAEHHILYKTVEEINRSRLEQPCVYVNIPKLSTRIEDWLLYPSSDANCANSDSSYLRPRSPPYNMSEWLKTPSQKTEGSNLSSTPLEKLSTDASIKNWLHKIKQCPLEEEEDFEFVEEMSDTKTSHSLEEFPRPLSPMAAEDAWLYGMENTHNMDTEVTFMFKIPDLPQEMWLLKTDDKADISPELKLDMSQYFTKISDELDKWLFKGCENSPMPGAISSSLEPSSENPWLMTSRSSSARSRSQSPAYSRTSSTTSLKSKKKSNINKWLLPSQSDQPSSPFSCPFMERYKKDMNNLKWLKSDQPSEGFKGVSNPMSSFENQSTDMAKWLKPRAFEKSSMQEKASPIASILDKYSKTTTDQWLLSGQSGLSDTENKFIDTVGLDGEERKWLMPATCLCPSVEKDDADAEDFL